MKFITAFLSLMFMMSASFAQNSKVSAVWGKVVQTEKTIKGVNFKYFVYFEKDGQSHAYPLETEKPEMAELIKKNINHNVLVEGQIKEMTLDLDGPKHKVLVFIPSTLKALTLSELALNEPVNVAQKNPVGAKKSPGAYNGGGIRLSDKATNAVIYTGAALMLGSLLKGMVIAQ